MSAKTLVTSLTFGSILFVLAGSAMAQKTKLPPKPTTKSLSVETPGAPNSKQAALEKALSKKLTNAALVGSFTVDGQKPGKAPAAERYELGTVKKVKDNYWLFVAKVKYGKKNYSIPVPITVKLLWAGDTPVITMTDVTIPAMGTFTARVLFYGDRYVGTWQHGKVGGHMFGKIEPAKAKSEDKAPEK